MHFSGLAGMPRRIPDYPDAYVFWNVLASWGSLISFFGVIAFLYTIKTAFVSVNNLYERSSDLFPRRFILVYAILDKILHKGEVMYTNISHILVKLSRIFYAYLLKTLTK